MTNVRASSNLLLKTILVLLLDSSLNGEWQESNALRHGMLIKKRPGSDKPGLLRILRCLVRGERIGPDVCFLWGL
jgi:hypothetical protein